MYTHARTAPCSHSAWPLLATLAAEATKEVGTRFFKHRTHFNTRQGLRGLVDITAHPAFGSYIRQIALCSLELHPSWQSCNLVPDGELSQESSKHRDANHQQVWPRWERELRDLHGNDVSFKLLSAAFANLRALGVPVCLAACPFGPAADAGVVRVVLPWHGQHVYGKRDIINLLYEPGHDMLRGVSMDDFPLVTPDSLEEYHSVESATLAGGVSSSSPE